MVFALGTHQGIVVIKLALEIFYGRQGHGSGGALHNVEIARQS